MLLQCLSSWCTNNHEVVSKHSGFLVNTDLPPAAAVVAAFVVFAVVVGDGEDDLFHRQ